MRRTYTAGEWCFVDYAGMPARYVEPETGEVREVPVFVAVLAASDYVYVEAQPAADTASWIAGHVHAFADFGGVPAIVSPDNTKTAVKRACRYEPDLNPSYQEMAEHYGVAIVPARVRKPRDKAPGEAAVLVVERWMLAPLRNLTFFGLAALNDGIREQRTRVNERPLRGLGVSRRQLLESIERPALRPLPEQPYEFAVHARATVAPDYHVAFEQNFYSVPYELLHQRLEVRATRTIVEIYRHGLRIAAHARAFGVGRYITNPAHMPPHHRFVAEWSPQRFVRWGKAKGPATAAMVEALLAAKAHPEQAYRACLGLLRLADVHGAERLDNACRRALHFRATSYKAVKNILDAELDRVAVDEGPAAPPRSHELLRGGAYYS
jgi:transposase